MHRLSSSHSFFVPLPFLPCLRNAAASSSLTLVNVRSSHRSDDAVDASVLLLCGGDGTSSSSSLSKMLSISALCVPFLGGVMKFPNVEKEDGDDLADPPPPRGGLLGVDFPKVDENHVDGAVRDFPDNRAVFPTAVVAAAVSTLLLDASSCCGCIVFALSMRGVRSTLSSLVGVIPDVMPLCFVVFLRLLIKSLSRRRSSNIAA
mmetsp:Transcript_32058/g.64763  ORF Transcript_32058/g.64763 Transcript_32058/m.64763 type:complete len:204 (-) Transcript_32058:254-865(-)